MPSGVKIKEYRLKKNLTQKELAAKCGMYESQIRKYELGTANPKIETLKKIANALEITVNQLGVSDSEQLIEVGRNLVHEHDQSYLEMLNLNFETKHDLGLISEEEYQSEKKAYYQKKDLLDAFNSLNVLGKDKAIEQTRILTKVPEYQQQSSQALNSSQRKTAIKNSDNSDNDMSDDPNI
ncbi:helix-turn-helix domain-containing protein [Eisenbergiella tayi]|uniref:helix-turn-helix domain-containing protein n=1 Tax=Eisenbergiella tayi TaxID=1432052 RepID=UPI0008491B1F|nr:helix-turn-helix transcriptional regulator [Eisenbergiella tayi]ODR41307.1 hypothetical protein BEI60_06355 [Eisenbergiella tayi]